VIHGRLPRGRSGTLVESRIYVKRGDKNVDTRANEQTFVEVDSRASSKVLQVLPKTENEEKIKKIFIFYFSKKNIRPSLDRDKAALRVTGYGRLVADHEAIFVWSCADLKRWWI
jgi:hypothetical protein